MDTALTKVPNNIPQGKDRNDPRILGYNVKLNSNVKSKQKMNKVICKATDVTNTIIININSKFFFTFTTYRSESCNTQPALVTSTLNVTAAKSQKTDGVNILNSNSYPNMNSYKKWLRYRFTIQTICYSTILNI